MNSLRTNVFLFLVLVLQHVFSLNNFRSNFENAKLSFIDNQDFDQNLSVENITTSKTQTNGSYNFKAIGVSLIVQVPLSEQSTRHHLIDKRYLY